MNSILRSASLLGVAAGTIGLTACDAPPPPKASAPAPIALEAIPASDTLVDLVRKSLGEILRDKDPYSRARRLGTLLPTLAAGAVPAVVQTLSDPTLDVRGADLALLVRFWASHDPEAAASWSKDLSALNGRDIALFSAIATWAEMDPQAARNFAWPWVVLPEIEVIVPVALVRGWFAANDPPELRKFLASLDPGIPGQRAIATYIRAKYEQQGADALLGWAESLPEKGEAAQAYKLTVFRRSADMLSQRDQDLEKAKTFCDKYCSGVLGINMRSIISRNWVLRDGPAAMAWLEAAPNGNDRDFSTQLTFGLWVDTKPEAAMAWMKEKTAGESPAWLVPAFPVYARTLAQDSPGDAIKWAEQITNLNSRKIMCIAIARLWRQRDEAAAEAWVQQSFLSEEDREKARVPIPTQ